MHMRPNDQTQWAPEAAFPPGLWPARHIAVTAPAGTTLLTRGLANHPQPLLEGALPDVRLPERERSLRTASDA
jgi:hypothetical protein